MKATLPEGLVVCFCGRHAGDQGSGRTDWAGFEPPLSPGSLCFNHSAAKQSDGELSMPLASLSPLCLYLSPSSVFSVSSSPPTHHPLLLIAQILLLISNWLWHEKTTITTYTFTQHIHALLDKFVVKKKKVSDEQEALSTALIEDQTCLWLSSLQRLAATLGAVITVWNMWCQVASLWTVQWHVEEIKAAVLLGDDHYEPVWRCVLHDVVKSLRWARYLLLPVVSSLNLLKCHKCAASWEPVGMLLIRDVLLWSVADTIRYVSRYNANNLID